MLTFLDNQFVQPLMMIYEFLFHLTPDVYGVGGQLIGFSVLLNLILMPIYNQMEQRSRRGRTIKDKVAADVARMKAHFRGRERYFYIRAVYRQHGYHPISDLLGSADLFVQIIVFATVFRFLSGLGALNGQSFGPIADLSRPDHLLHGVNLLPFIMTAVNAAAVLSYVEDKTRRLQALGLALVFLALLYGSASGLVLYWTTNNLFSFARNRIQQRVAQEGAGRLTPLFSSLKQQQ